MQASCQTTNATQKNLYLDNTTTLITLTANSVQYFKARIVGKVTGASDSVGVSIEGMIQMGATAATAVILGTPTFSTLWGTTTGLTWGSGTPFAVAADTTHGALSLLVTGAASTTVDWFASIEWISLVY